MIRTILTNIGMFFIMLFTIIMQSAFFGVIIWLSYDIFRGKFSLPYLSYQEIFIFMIAINSIRVDSVGYLFNSNPQIKVTTKTEENGNV